MNKILLIAVVGLLLVGIVGFIYNNKEIKDIDEKVYQGPVRPTDDLEHFRKQVRQ